MKSTTYAGVVCKLKLVGGSDREQRHEIWNMKSCPQDRPTLPWRLRQSWRGRKRQPNFGRQCGLVARHVRNPGGNGTHEMSEWTSGSGSGCGCWFDRCFNMPNLAHSLTNSLRGKSRQFTTNPSTVRSIRSISIWTIRMRSLGNNRSQT